MAPHGRMPGTDARGRTLILMVLAMMAWGGAWPSGKAMAHTAHPWVLVFWRFLLTACSLLPFMFVQGRTFRVGAKPFLFLSFGAILYIVYNMFFYLGLQNGKAGVGGVLVTTLNPVLTFLLVWLIYRSSAGLWQKLGLALGLAGGAVIVYGSSGDISGLLLSGNLFFPIAALVWAVLSLHSKYVKTNTDPIGYSFFVSILGALLACPLAFAQGGISDVFEQGLLFWGNLFYVSIVSTTFGTTVFFYAIQRLGAAQAGAFTFLVPLSALTFSWLFLGEVPSAFVLAGGIMGMLAVVLIQKNPRQATERP